MPKVKTTTTELLNDLTLTDYYDYLSSLCMSIFEWQGLPESINERYLEQILFNEGRILFFHDENIGHLALKCFPSEQLNYYNEPVAYTTCAVGYENRRLGRDESVLIRDNYLEKPPCLKIDLIAQRLANAERTIDINVHAQRTPVLLQGTDKQQLSLQTLYTKYDGFAPVLFGDKELNRDSLKVLKTDAPFIADKLQNYKHQLMNEALTFIGINNANTDKKERVQSAEVEANDYHVDMSLQTRLMTREKAAEQINKMFGLTVSVKVRDFVQLESEIEEGEELE